MNKFQAPEETTLIDNVSKRIPPACIVCPEAAPPTQADALRTASAIQGEYETAYRILVESNPNPVWIHDCETLQFLHVNEAAIQHYGYSLDEFLAMTLTDICPTEVVPLFLESLVKAVKSDIQRGVWRHRKKNGEIIEVQSTVQDFPFRGKSARLTMAQDVTEHRRIERALQQGEQEQRQLAERLRKEQGRLTEAQAVAKVGSWEYDPATGKISWSKQMFSLLGFDPEEGEPDYATLMALYHPDDVAALEACLLRALKEGREYALDLRRSTEGNVSQRWYHASGRPIKAETGEITRLVGILQDITERKQAEEAQEIAGKRLRFATESGEIGVWDYKIGDETLVWDERMLQIYDFTPETFPGAYAAWSERLHPEDKTRVEAALQEAIRGGRKYDPEFRILLPNGQIRYIKANALVLKDENGVPIQMIGLNQDITEKKQTEQTLHHIMDGAHCLLWQAEVEEFGDERLQWRMRLASEEAAQRFIPLHVPAGGKYADAWFHSRPLEDQERTNLYGNGEVRASRSYQQEFRSHSKDGTVYWLSENVRVEPLGEGKWRCTGVCTDITERKLAEEAARAVIRGAQCLLWYAIAEETPRGIQWYIETPDEEAAQQFFPVAQPPGMTYVEAWTRRRTPEGNALMNARSSGALLGGEKSYTQQFQCCRADSEWRWLSETVSIEALTPGRWRCVGVCTDVTEQKQAEEERDRFFTLSLDLLCVADPNGHFIRLNPAFETVLGFTSAELMDRPFLDFVHPDDQESTIAEVGKLSAGERTLHFENRYLCLDGSYRWLAWTSIAFQGFLYAAAHDITTVKEAEIVLLRANEDLEARVEERTIQITEANAQLLTAKNEADRANLAKSEFLSRMSHELRTPLNAILGFGQLLDQEALTPFQQESMGYILKGGRHLLDLINEVLDLARVEAGHIALSLEPIALLEDIREACDLVRPLALENGILLILDADSLGSSYIQADRQRLKQVLLNLLSNAIKYNFHGGKVRIYGVHRSKDRFCIAIEDTGRGLTSEEQQRLFVPFERLNAADSGIEGTGLGLVLTQRLVTAMEGSLTLESLPGKGMTFFVELGLVPAPVEILAYHPIGAYEPQTDPSEKPNATVLYIEDNLSNMRLLEVLLRSRPGTTLLPAMQGSVGLDLARQHEPDLILLDLHLPDISGTEVLARLQRSALTRDIPVVILSADATASQIERLLRAGAGAYLTKPLDITEFLHTLDTLLPFRQAEGLLGTEVAT